MTREEALERLREMEDAGGRDLEADHSEADSILLALIDDPEITEAWDKVGKWYA